MDHDDAGTRLFERIIELVLLEDDIMTACERAAARQAGNHGRPNHPRHWSRAMWRRYLAEAVRIDRVLSTRINRLRGDISWLERLAAASAENDRDPLGALNRQDDEFQPAPSPLT
jgi:hypothetical protein